LVKNSPKYRLNNVELRLGIEGGLHRMNSLHPVKGPGKVLAKAKPAVVIRALPTHPMTGSQRMRGLHRMNSLHPVNGPG